MATMLLITSEQAFCLRPCSVASAFVMAPFVMAFPPAFIDFMGGSMTVSKGREIHKGNAKDLMNC